MAREKKEMKEGILEDLTTWLEASKLLGEFLTLNGHDGKGFVECAMCTLESYDVAVCDLCGSCYMDFRTEWFDGKICHNCILADFDDQDDSDEYFHEESTKKDGTK